MGFFHHEHESAKANVEVYGTEGHKSHWSHELIGGAAAFEAMKAYNTKQAAEGKPVSHQKAKELAAAFAAAEIDKLFETKGLDYIDKEKAKHHAKKQAEQAVDAEWRD